MPKILFSKTVAPIIQRIYSSCTEYSSHIWGSSSSIYFLDRSIAMQLTNSPKLTSKLEKFALCHNVCFLSLIHRYCFSLCSRKQAACVPVVINWATKHWARQCIRWLLHGHCQLKGEPLWCLFLSLYCQALELFTFPSFSPQLWSAHIKKASFSISLKTLRVFFFLLFHLLSPFFHIQHALHPLIIKYI